jgi:hypothetical protein
MSSRIAILPILAVLAAGLSAHSGAFEAEAQHTLRPEPSQEVPELEPISASSWPTLELQLIDTLHLQTESGGPLMKLALGPGDRVHGVELGTHSVQVFSTDGKLERVGRLLPDDFPYKHRTPRSLTVTDSGEVLLMNVRFDAQGRRLGPSPIRCSLFGSSLHAQHGSEFLWAIRGDRIERIRPDGEILCRIECTPSNQWLYALESLAVAPDGGVAVVTGSPSGETRGDQGLHLYSPRGEPIRSLPPLLGMYPNRGLAYDGERIALGLAPPGEPCSVILLATDGRPLGRFALPGAKTSPIPYFAANRAELWLFDGERTLERYRFP